jgi:hypothetical protein
MAMSFRVKSARGPISLGREFFDIRDGLKCRSPGCLGQQSAVPPSLSAAWAVGARIMPAAGNGGYRAMNAPAWMVNRVDLMTNDTGLGNATPGRRLSCVPLLSSLDESSLAAFEAEFEWVSVPSGSTLFREDQVADAVYVVIAGCLGVTVRGNDGQDVLVARTRAGETIGRWGCSEADYVRRRSQRFVISSCCGSENPPSKNSSNGILSR